MRILTLLAVLSLLTACGNPNRPAAPTPPALPAATAPAAATATSTIQLTCPSQFTAVTKLPSGSRVLGSFRGTLLLLQAQLSTGTPSSIEDNWRLSALPNHEENESTKLPDGGLLTGYALKPVRSRVPGEIEEYLLACSYGPNWEAMSSRSNAALVLIPVPAASTARCEIIDAPSQDDVAQPPRSATCTIQSGPREASPQVRTFLEQLYATYQPDRGPDTRGNDAPRLFSAKLFALIRETQQPVNDEVGPLDGDPICNCQDWQALTVLRISVVALNEDEAAAKVTFTNAGKPVTIGMNLLREAGQWRIDDLSEPAPRGLVWYLSEALQERRMQAP